MCFIGSCGRIYNQKYTKQCTFATIHNEYRVIMNDKIIKKNAKDNLSRFKKLN